MSYYVIKGKYQGEMIGGTPFDDLIIAGAGNDTVWGYRGDDAIGDTANIDVARSFDDTYFGGAGNDKLTSYSGNDVLNGGKGNDLFFVFNDTGNLDIEGGKGRNYDVLIIDGHASDYFQEFTPDGHVRIENDANDQVINATNVERIVFARDESEWWDF